MKAHPAPNKATAVSYGLFVQEAYDMFDANPDELNPPPTKSFPAGYDLLLTVQMTAADKKEFIGFFARSETDKNSPLKYSYVVAFRGTRTSTDAVVDADTYLVPFDDRKPKETVPGGVRDFYRTLTIMAPQQGAVQPLAEAFSLLSVTPRDAYVVATGHSLGAWLATLYSFEIATKGVLNPTIFTFAFPKAGNHDFVTSFNTLVSNSYRIANVQDEVTKLPLDDAFNHYEHVKGEWTIDGRNKVKDDVLCQHYLGTYLYLLSGEKKYVDPTCTL